MKAILFFALLVVLISADYTPKWQSCSGTNDPWQPTNATLAKEPANNQRNSAHSCGNVQKEFTIASYKVTIWSSFTVIYTGTVTVPQQDLQAGSSYCFDYNFYIPPIIKGDYTISFDIQNADDDGAGCLTLYMTL
jgi:hypothetical protein